MSFISITRLRIRSVRFLPAFALYTHRANRQVKEAAGFQGGRLLATRHWTFWTMTAWDNQASMRNYITTGDHKLAMPKLMNWCDEASVVHWEQPNNERPSWLEGDGKMRAAGRPSKLRKPSAQHATMSFQTPRVTTGGEIRPNR